MLKAAAAIFYAACLTTLLAYPAAAGAPDKNGSSVEVEKPAATPPDSTGGYRPPWANPDAKPPEPGVENDPTTFNPADVDVDTDQLNNNISPIDPD